MWKTVSRAGSEQPTANIKFFLKIYKNLNFLLENLLIDFYLKLLRQYFCDIKKNLY